RGDPAEGRGPVRRYAPHRGLARAGHGERVSVEVEVRAGGGGGDREGAGGRGRRTAHRKGDRRCPAGGHAHGLGVGTRHRAVGRDAGGRQPMPVGGGGEVAGDAVVRSDRGGTRRVVLVGDRDRVRVEVAVRAGGGVACR